MASNRAWSFGPLALTNTLTTNILNCNITSLSGPVGFTATQLYILLRHVRVVNKTASAVTVSLWKGATGANAAGTEFLWQAYPVPANGFIEWYGAVRLDAVDFLVGGASASAALSIQGEGEIGCT